jgi:hypothetical protein
VDSRSSAEEAKKKGAGCWQWQIQLVITVTLIAPWGWIKFSWILNWKLQFNEKGEEERSLPVWENRNPHQNGKAHLCPQLDDIGFETNLPLNASLHRLFMESHHPLYLVWPYLRGDCSGLTAQFMRAPMGVIRDRCGIWCLPLFAWAQFGKSNLQTFMPPSFNICGKRHRVKARSEGASFRT